MLTAQMNLSALRKLLADFYSVTGQRIGIFDNNFNILIEHPQKHSPFCSKIRSTPEGSDKCKACDINGMKVSAKTGKTYYYRCHAGLVEVCCPIIEEEGISGFLMFGQVLYDNNLERQRDEVWSKCKGLIKDYGEFCSLYESVRKIPSDYLNAAANIMTACVGYIRLEQLIKLSKSSLWEQMVNYIEKKAGTHFTLDEMSNDLSVSISTLCKTAKAHSGKTVFQLVNEYRISRAKEILADDTMSIADVASRVGLDDYNYFTRLFKKATGITPTAYRRQLKKAN